MIRISKIRTSMYDSEKILLWSPANFLRSTLVTARSWWIPCSQDPNLRRWSRITSPMERTGRRCSAINFLIPYKHIYWVESSGYLTGESFQQNSEDNGACIVCCGEDWPLWRTRTGHTTTMRNRLIPITVLAKIPQSTNEEF